MKTLAIALAALSLASVARAGEADVLDVRANKDPDGTWTFAVTVHHEDEGWEHYAVGWEIVGPDGKALDRRILHHPHVEPNTFTRPKKGIAIPEGVTEVVVRVEDKVHGFGGKEMRVDLTASPAVGRPIESGEPAPSSAPDAGASPAPEEKAQGATPSATETKHTED